MSEIQLIPFEQNKDSQTFRDCVRLMKANFSDPSATNSDSIDWLYLKNPYKKAIGYIAYDGKKPVSQLYMIFQQINHENKKRNIGILSNLCTEKEYRNKGLFNRLVSQLLNDAKQFNIPFVWAYPNPSSLHGFKRPAFKSLKIFHLKYLLFHIFLLRKNFCEKKKLPFLEKQKKYLDQKPLMGFKKLVRLKKKLLFLINFTHHLIKFN